MSDALGSLVRKRSFWLATAAIVLVAAAVAVIALGGDGDDVRSGSEGPTTETPTCTSAPPTLPLLGTPGEPPARAALAVKIENTQRGRPQSGLNQADVVFEEMVEGRLTRLLAVYHSDDPGTVGPVRSARSTDLSILAELGRPLFAWSGANPTFRALVEAANLVDVGYSAVPDAYRRAGDRKAPYNLFASPEDLRAAGEEKDAEACRTVPAPLFSYRPAGEPLGGPGVVAASGYSSSGLSTDVRWDWDAEAGWVRTQDGTAHVDADGARVAVPNVIIRLTPYRDSGQRDSVGAVVPEAVAVGEGDAWLLSDGKAQPGRWSKPAPDEPTTYTDSDGNPLRLTPGQTWVEVLPPESGGPS